MKFNFSWIRFICIAHKEFIQMKRDKLTFSMMILIPLLQLILFGYAINMTPRHLPTAVTSADNSYFTKNIIRSLNNTDYFKTTNKTLSVNEAEKQLSDGKYMFVLHIPPNFSTDLIQGRSPSLLLEVDGTDPISSSAAVSASQILTKDVLNPLLVGPLAKLQSKKDPFNIIVHAKYNPGQVTQYNIVPGLLGVVLVMTMVMITSLALTREQERGTIESLLATPAKPLEVILGKIIPYIIVGYAQVILILLFAFFVFKVPMLGSLWLLAIVMFPYIASLLAVGLTFSVIAKNQLQAVQMAFFYFLPSILLSGFMFPFSGMPLWAQYIGQAFPLTHFLRIDRGILLKGYTWNQVYNDLWPIILFMLIIILIGFKRYRRTLD